MAPPTPQVSGVSVEDRKFPVTENRASGSGVDNSNNKASEPASVMINLKIVEQDSNEIEFKVNRNAPLRKLMNIYLESKNLEINSVKFFYDGRHFKPNQTAAELGMEDDDQIDAMLPQMGGSIIA